MTKRKLTRRQAWRIEKIQKERVSRASKRNDQVEQQLEGGDLGPEQEGLIISHFGKQVDVEALGGELSGQIFRCYMRTNLGQLVTGDKVIWRHGEQSSVVVAALPRSSELVRPSNQGELKPVAANIDQIIITFAVEPMPHANLLDRYLVAAELSGIKPILLLNKIDLLTEQNRSHVESLLQRYQAIGYSVIKVASTESTGLEPLLEQLEGKISVFVGQSGVGKSSLINTLLPNSDIKVGELSEQSRKGRHTTTTARLFHFPCGGDLIDSPGIREFALWHIEPDELLEGFVEFKPFIGHCRFRDCKHEHEPSCAILNAIDAGKINQSRMDSYQRILHSLTEPAG